MIKKCITIILFSLCVTTNSFAWYFIEHEKLGEKAFVEACKFLRSGLSGDQSALELLEAIPCYNEAIQARKYGLRSALSGDHIDKPDDFLKIDAEIQSLSLINYGILATKNHEHFWPHVKEIWQKHHEEAVRKSLIARKYFNDGYFIKAKKEFEYALILSSFADHFLQDAFSVGHSGFSRINSLQNPSLNIHNKMNRQGRWMKRRAIHPDAFNINIQSQERISKLSKKIHTCNSVFDGFELYNNELLIKDTNELCNIDIWYAYGDEMLREDENNNNCQRIINTNKSSIVSVMHAFIKNKDTAYSLVAEAQFPTSTEYFKENSEYVNAAIKVIKKYIPVKPKNSLCNGSKPNIYKENNKCWFDIDNSYTEAVYSDITIMLSTNQFANIGSAFQGIYIAYSPYSKFTSFPKNLRFYVHASINRSDKYLINDGNQYAEVGLNFTLPNYYAGTIFSHELDIGYASISKISGSWYESRHIVEDGLYLGLNTNLDILSAKVTFGLGWFIPDTDLSNAELKGQIMIGWSFGAVGGGPLSKWD